MFERDLLVHPRPQAGESFRGYLLRLGDANALAPKVDLYSHVRSTQHNARSHELLRLQERWGIPTSTLPSRWQSTGQGRWSRARVQQCVVCPPCLRESPIALEAWECSYACACPKHRRWLMDLCPKCREPLSWRRPDVTTCACGCDLSLQPTKKAPAAQVDISVALLSGMLDLANMLVDTDERLPAQFVDLDTDAQIDVLTHPWSTSFDAEPGCLKGLWSASAGLREQARVAACGAKMLAQWPQWLHGRVQERIVELAAGADVDLVKATDADPLLGSDPTSRLPLMFQEEIVRFTAGKTVTHRGMTLLCVDRARVAASADAAGAEFVGRLAARRARDADRLARSAAASTMRVAVADLAVLEGAGVLPAGKSLTIGDIECGRETLMRHLRDWNLAQTSSMPLASVRSVGSRRMQVALVQAIVDGRVEGFRDVCAPYMGLDQVYVWRNEVAAIPQLLDQDALSCCS